MKIVIDAGHGYQTAGKRSKDGLREYEFNRQVAMFTKTLLEQYEKVSVFFTHSDERDVPLKERTNKANQLAADVFVSIHANAFGSGEWNSAGGIETYMYTSKPKGASELARLVQRQLCEKTKRKDRGVKTADFYVLRETKMTAILCECGFMTNYEEAQLLKSKAYQQLCAEAIVEALCSYYSISRKSNEDPKQYAVQVGVFEEKPNAEKLIKELKSKGYDALIKEVRS
ncbi:N-acetylmuramoyl-L-alanine amidase [Bacillus sp. PS06]|uniref:N-acetylmuramoyl-L-alanine amidase n=1 Tax=Bacillus sp. PS06 TaxID=2764176 RepID=UPI0017870728|nr:N-acetylmuramoyl-L-alanine amidase [Bacillus sp. PS06]MBD8067501.1 N-acetylmuramoyl-L-alanine amidase [Bacillus sp. PS06]